MPGKNPKAKKLPKRSLSAEQYPNRNITSQDPDKYYNEHPAWGFRHIDTEHWSITGEKEKQLFWSEVLQKLKEFETQTWSDILVQAKKQNHPIDVDTLNPVAQKRLEKLYIEPESLISLRFQGTHRLYGYMEKSVFQILWYDLDHSDNDTCVCRSHKKYT